MGLDLSLFPVTRRVFPDLDGSAEGHAGFCAVQGRLENIYRVDEFWRGPMGQYNNGMEK